MKMVKVLDPDTDEVTTIPISELASGMMRITFEGDPTEYYVEASKVKSKGEFRHPPDVFDEDDLRLIRGIECTFRDVNPQSFQEWVDGFRCDTNPTKEIGLWLLMGHVFLHFTRARNLNHEKRKDIFDVVLATMNNGPDAAAASVSCPTLSRKRIREIVDYMRERMPAKPEWLGEWMADVIEQAEGERPPVVPDED